MPTLVRDPQPVEFEALLERRRQLGQDLMDEVWDGVYVMNPAPGERHAEVVQQLAEVLGPVARAAGLIPRMSIFNLGEPQNYRIPDGALVRERGNRVYVPTAALVVEVISPADDTWKTLDFYAAHEVDELLIVDPEQREVHWLRLTPNGDHARVERSELIGLGPELAGMIDWP